MKAYWTKLSGREQALIALAGAILIVLGLQLLVFRPLVDYRRQGEVAVRSAADLLAEVRSGAAEARALKAVAERRDAGADNGSVRQLASAGARRHGIRIARLRPSDDGGLTIWIDAVRPTTLQAWLVDLFDQHGILVSRASMSKEDDGRLVSAQILVSRGAAR